MRIALENSELDSWLSGLGLAIQLSAEITVRRHRCPQRRCHQRPTRLRRPRGPLLQPTLPPGPGLQRQPASCALGCEHPRHHPMPRRATSRSLPLRGLDAVLRPQRHTQSLQLVWQRPAPGTPPLPQRHQRHLSQQDQHEETQQHLVWYGGGDDQSDSSSGESEDDSSDSSLSESEEDQDFLQGNQGRHQALGDLEALDKLTTAARQYATPWWRSQESSSLQPQDWSRSEVQDRIASGFVDRHKVSAVQREQVFTSNFEKDSPRHAVRQSRYSDKTVPVSSSSPGHGRKRQQRTNADQPGQPKSQSRWSQGITQASTSPGDDGCKARLFDRSGCVGQQLASPRQGFQGNMKTGCSARAGRDTGAYSRTEAKPNSRRPDFRTSTPKRDRVEGHSQFEEDFILPEDQVKKIPNFNRTKLKKIPNLNQIFSMRDLQGSQKGIKTHTQSWCQEVQRCQEVQKIEERSRSKSSQFSSHHSAQ